LLNLVSNAIKFTEKGKVDISCYVTSDSPTAQTIKMVVQDTGIGMTPSFIETLFNKFTQEDDSVTRRFGGTGLGMSICKQLLDLMGGTVHVTSEKGKGTTMSISINFAKGKQEDLPQKSNTLINEQVFTGKKIMVVDDNEMNRVVAQIILESYGAHITVAIDGVDALEKANEHFDIILMDIQMPQMDGLEATRLIRKKIGNSIPIIALTAMTLKGDEEKMRRAGMQGYLYKPFEEVQLLSIIANQLKTEPPTLIPIAQSQPLTENIPLFSIDKLNSITKNNPAFTQRLLRLFMEQVPAAMHTMQAAYQQGDFTLIKKTAHRLIASIDNMGIEVLKQEIRDIEKNATVYGISPQLEGLLNYVDDVVKKIVLQIKNYVE
jgi:CheY-like chemotaxis protein/anti-sigma regulatory factor (Ser/Thr protein kinase)